MTYKDEKIIEGVADAIIRNLPLVVFLFAVNILRELISWPLALGLAAFSFGLISYWIPDKSKRNFLLWMSVSALTGAAFYGFAHLLIRLGWVNR
jgi:drug/metabolite transporter (DMT)-like permease